MNSKFSSPPPLKKIFKSSPSPLKPDLILFQAEVLGGAILQQTFVVEYVVAYQMCTDCHRVEAKVSKRFFVEFLNNFFPRSELCVKHDPCTLWTYLDDVKNLKNPHRIVHCTLYIVLYFVHREVGSVSIASKVFYHIGNISSNVQCPLQNF